MAKHVSEKRGKVKRRATHNKNEVMEIQFNDRQRASISGAAAVAASAACVGKVHLADDSGISLESQPSDT